MGKSEAGIIHHEIVSETAFWSPHIVLDDEGEPQVTSFDELSHPSVCSEMIQILDLMGITQEAALQATVAANKQIRELYHQIRSRKADIAYCWATAPIVERARRDNHIFVRTLRMIKNALISLFKIKPMTTEEYVEQKLLEIRELTLQILQEDAVVHICHEYMKSREKPVT